MYDPYYKTCVLQSLTDQYRYTTSRVVISYSSSLCILKTVLNFLLTTGTKRIRSSTCVYTSDRLKLVFQFFFQTLRLFFFFSFSRPKDLPIHLVSVEPWDLTSKPLIIQYILCLVTNKTLH